MFGSMINGKHKTIFFSLREEATMGSITHKTWSQTWRKKLSLAIENSACTSAIITTTIKISH